MAGEGGLFVGSLYGTLELDAKPFHQTLSSATKKGEKDLLDGLNQLGRQAAFGFGLGFVGFKLEGLFKNTIDEARQAVHETRLTEAVLRSTGGTAHVSAKQVDDLANSLSKVAGVDDEVISGGERVLLTFLNVRNEAGKGNDIFTQATKAAVDMSAALGGDLQSSIIAVGKALNEPATGALALSRNGSLARSDLHKLQEMMKAGTPLIEQQRFILQKLGEQYSGAAAAGASAGDKLHVSIKNLEESVGTALLPEINALDKGLGAVADGFTALPGPAQTIIATLGSVATAAVAGTIAMKKLSEALEGTALMSGLDTLRLHAMYASEAFGAGGLLGAISGAVAGGLIFKRVLDSWGDAGGVKQVKGAFEEADGALNELTRTALATHFDKAGLADAFAKAGLTMDDFVKAAHSGKPALDELGMKLRTVGGADIQLTDTLGDTAKAMEEGSSKGKSLAKVMGTGAVAAADLTDRMEKLAAATEKRVNAAFDAHIGHLVDVLSAAQGVTSAESGLEDAIKGTGDQAASSASKMKTYADAVSQVFDAVLAADRAHLAAKRSLTELTQTNKEFTGDAVARLQGLIRLDGKQVATQDDVHSALLDVIEAREREVDAMANSGEIADTAAARHQALVDKLLDLRTQYPELTDDIDKYLDAARKIPELPLEAAIDRTTTKQHDMADATLAVVTALLQQAQADDDPIHGLETMNTQLDALIQKYKDFPAAKDKFSQALAESILTEAQILAQQMHLPIDLIAGILNLPSTDRTGAFAGLFGLSYDPPHKAMGGSVSPNMPYKVGENGEEVFWPTSAGTIIPNGGFGDVVHLTVVAPTSDADALARRAVFELRTLSMSRR